MLRRFRRCARDARLLDRGHVGHWRRLRLRLRNVRRERGAVITASDYWASLRARYEAGTVTNAERDLIDTALVQSWQEVRKASRPKARKRNDSAPAEHTRTHRHAERLRLSLPSGPVLIFDQGDAVIAGSPPRVFRSNLGVRRYSTHADRFQNVGDDAALIWEWLTRGAWSEEDVRNALGRGQPSSEREQLRRYLGCRFAELAAQGATWAGIARALGKSKGDGIARLARESFYAEWANGSCLTGSVFPVMVASKK